MVWYENSQTADLLGFSQRTVSRVYAKQSKKEKMSTEWFQAERVRHKQHESMNACCLVSTDGGFMLSTIRAGELCYER